MVCKASTRLCGPTFPRDFSLWCCQTLFRHRPLQRRRRELRRLEDESASYSSNVCWAPDPSLFSSRTSRHSKARILTNPDIITSFKARSKYIWGKNHFHKSGIQDLRLLHRNLKRQWKNCTKVNNLQSGPNAAI